MTSAAFVVVQVFLKAIVIAPATSQTNVEFVVAKASLKAIAIAKERNRKKKGMIV